MDAVVGLVGGEVFRGVAEAEAGEGLAFPCLVLASVGRERGRVCSSGEAGEGATGFNLGKLAGISDSTTLAPV